LVRKPEQQETTHKENHMAKKVKAAKETNGAAPVYTKPQIPEGYQKQTTDIVGFWDPNIVAGKMTAIHFIPLEVKLFDSKLDNKKPSAVVVGKLIDPIPLNAPGGEGEVTEGQAGDIIGVWYKPGMSDLKQLANVKVLMYPTGEIETGKPNPMKTFDCLSKQKGGELHVTQDARKTSRNVQVAFAGVTPSGNAKENAQRAPEPGEDDIPF
jgi:hypothetical protein